MACVTDNPAASRPKSHLTIKQRELLLAISPRLCRPMRNGWLVRGKPYGRDTANRLIDLGLVRQIELHGRPALMHTLAGEIALTRLQ